VSLLPLLRCPAISGSGTVWLGPVTGRVAWFARRAALNRSCPLMAMSTDGGPFAAKSPRGVPVRKLFGDFTIGALYGDKALLDEVIAFRRPLTRDEAGLLHGIGADRK